MEQKYAEYAAQKAVELLAIDSPTGFTDRAAAWVQDAFGALGFAAKKTAKGGVLIDLGGAESEEGALLLQAHTDTLGAMVAEVKANGRLRVTNLGGMRAENGETENVRVYTRGGKVYEGTLQLCNASVHVNGDYGKTERTFDTTEVLLDEAVTSADETRALGIETGDIVCFDPRTRVTASGYIKSRFLDDKLSVGILLGFAKYLRDENKQLPRRTYVHVTVYEEVGHGGAGSVPAGVTESISVDMGCVGEGLSCREQQVSICAKDSSGPYDYEMTGELIALAKSNGIDYAVDVYPAYGSDAAAALRAVEIGADAILLAKNVDGVYDSDPRVNPEAKLLRDITYQEVQERDLKVMDASAITICRENKVPCIRVFGLDDPQNILRVIEGDMMGTVVHP